MTKIFARALLVSMIGIMSVPVAASAAPATVCTGTITGGTYASIEVPAGASCTLTNVTVTGQTKAREDSQLTATGSSFKTVHGLKSEIVRLTGNTISRHVHIQQGDVNDPGTDILVEDNLIGGQVHIHHNTGTIRVLDNAVQGHILVQHNESRLFVTDNIVGKGVQVMKTTGDSEKSVTGNAVDGKLHCFDNDAPFVGGPNNSAGKVKGDCFV